ncbi:MAG: YdaU family protein [Ramlibacter sp.]|nr:YdaU family protein [Ramlibacter sp.]
MNYYKRHIGDYAAATRHLSLLEHGVYGMLLDVYYTSEKQLPLDLRAVQRLVGAKSDDEREAVQIVLTEFFEQTPDGWRQTRCDEEIHHKQAKSETNQVIGRLGGRPKEITDSVIPESQTIPKETETDSDGFQSDKPNGTQANSHKPIANRDSPDGESVADKSAPHCPHLEILALFGERLPELPQPKPELWDGRNAENMRARWRWVLNAKYRTGARAGQRYASNRVEALDWFDRFFRYVAGSDFLMGRRGDFTCSLQWLMKAGNFDKVVQGNYENKAAA